MRDRPDISRRLRYGALLLSCTAFSIVAGCGEPADPQSASGSRAGPTHEDLGLSDTQWARVEAMALVPELPFDPTNRHEPDQAAVEFGHRLFFESGLSGSGTVSCATCHDPARAFTDGLPVALGAGTNRRNTPTVLNVAHQRWLTWDGRADSLWSQALEPMENLVEMAGDRVQILRTIAESPELLEGYRATFGPLPELDGLPAHARPRLDGGTDDWSRAWDEIDPGRREAITAAFVNLGKALGAYQRRLVSVDSAFDRFVADVSRGVPHDRDSFGEAALRGLELFTGDAGCWECHAGPMMTTGAFHDIGVPPVAGGMPTDAGRYDGAKVVRNDPFNAAGSWSDRSDGVEARLVRSLVNSPDNWGRFRTPSLREVARTAPYMHEGRFKTLAEVVRFYSTLEGAVRLDHHQEMVLSPLDLSEEDQAALVAFLETLDGRLLEPDLAADPR